MKKERGFSNGVKIGICFFIFLFLFFSFSSLVSASCSLGATPLGLEAKVQPGGKVEVVWNFYNLYGDRTTHITVGKLSGPDWKITYEPELHTASYDVSGVIVNKTENLAVENMTTVLTTPENPPEGINYVKHPSKEGYIPVKIVKMYITVPENAKLWQNYEFIFQGKGECFMEPGAVIPAVATQLKVIITPTTEYSEKPVSEGGVTGTGFSILGMGTASSILFITTIVFILLLFFLLIKGARKSAKEKVQATENSAVDNTQTPVKPDSSESNTGGKIENNGSSLSFGFSSSS